MIETDISWHKDGHIVEFMLDKSNLLVSGFICPDTEGECRNKHGLCVVKLFVDMYGMECNVGVASIHRSMEFAWAFMGEMDDPLESSQVWIIPVDDDIFSAWATAQNQNGTS